MSTEINVLAERLLFGQQLEDKLHRPDQLIDRHPVGITVAPALPGRPDAAAWTQRQSPFPKESQFSDDVHRGRALLFFANHELLAIELMALCLLRFPDAPPHFRRGLLNTIFEEQDHFRRYYNRAAELGVRLEDVGVNRFFWDCLSTMQDPFDFVVGMAMTFEQANLDHCIHYQALFERVGDHQSAEIMATIYADEIRHLRQGIRWFRHWKDPHQDDFEAHQQHLKLPLSMARAKGRSFDSAGRIAAGLSKDYVAQLQVTAISKGRLPNVLIFWPNVEAYIAQPHQQLPASALKVAESMAFLPIVQARHGDILLVRTPPSIDFLKPLQDCGWTLPQCVVWDGKNWPVELNDRRINAVLPWGWGPVIAQIVPPTFSQWQAHHHKLHSKAWSTELLREWCATSTIEWGTQDQELGVLCRTYTEIESAIASFDVEWLVLKAELGTAGRQSIRIAKGQISQAQQKSIHRILQSQAIVVEPWLERLLDLSVQLRTTASGTVDVLGWNRFWTTANGQYRGHWLGPVHRHLPEFFRRWMYQVGGSKGLNPTIHQLAQQVGKALLAEGFVGTAGVDMLIHRVGDQLRLRPIVEINPRQTMGQMALEAQRKCRSPDALFLILDSRRVSALQAEFPPVGNERLENGILKISSGTGTHCAILAAGAAAVHLLQAEALDVQIHRFHPQAPSIQ